ncbi:hypothetical protein IWQ55_006211 [Labrenzia sp. EL_208]|nr:hypothetical protein [Labrenzia sp. EL_132]MBG6232977.1 hypothetical protein [Labrenzia sp. EL_208]
MRSDVAKRAVDAAFERLGVDSQYGSTPCKLLFENDEDVGIDFGGASRPVGRETIFLVRDSEVAPVDGGTFTVNSETHRIVAKPVLKDAARLVWRCRVVLQNA